MRGCCEFIYPEIGQFFFDGFSQLEWFWSHHIMRNESVSEAHWISLWIKYTNILYSDSFDQTNGIENWHYRTDIVPWTNLSFFFTKNSMHFFHICLAFSDGTAFDGNLLLSIECIKWIIWFPSFVTFRIINVIFKKTRQFPNSFVRLSISIKTETVSVDVFRSFESNQSFHQMSTCIEMTSFTTANYKSICYWQLNGDQHPRGASVKWICHDANLVCDSLKSIMRIIPIFSTRKPY